MPTLQEQGGFSKSLAELFGGYLHHGSLWINQKWQNVTFMIVQNLSRSKNNINSFECWKYHDGKPWELCRRQVRITLIHISESGQLKVYLHHFLKQDDTHLDTHFVPKPLNERRESLYFSAQKDFSLSTEKKKVLGPPWHKFVFTNRASNDSLSLSLTTFASASQFHIYLMSVNACLAQCFQPGKALVGGQEKALVGAFPVIVKSSRTFVWSSTS